MSAVEVPAGELAERAEQARRWVAYLRLTRSELVWRWGRAVTTFREAQEQLTETAHQLDDTNFALAMAEGDFEGRASSPRRHLGVVPPVVERDEEGDAATDARERAVRSYRERRALRPDRNSLETAASTLAALEPGATDADLGAMTRAVLAAELADTRDLIERETNRRRAPHRTNRSTR